MSNNESNVGESSMGDGPTIEAKDEELQQAGPEGESVAQEPVSELDERLAQIEQLQTDLAAANDQALRVAAEMQNVRKRTERDVENAHKFGQEKLVASLLPVLDSLDRAITTGAEGVDAGSDGFKSLLEGVELTRKSAIDALEKHSVKLINPVGEPFDPEFHEAMTMVPSETAEPNSVLEVLQKGYTLHGRLLRAAMVVVSK